MRSIRIAVIGFALACLWSTAGGLKAAIIKVEYDFSTYPAVPFTLEGGVARWYQDMNTGALLATNNPATITAAGMQAQMLNPGLPYIPSTNPEARLSGVFHAGVIGFQILWNSSPLTTSPTLHQQAASAWTFADVTPLLDFTGINHFAAEGNYITDFTWYDTTSGYEITGIKLYIDTSVNVNVPDGSPQIAWLALLGVFILARGLAARRL